MTDDFELRDVLESDLATFFAQQLDAGANDMAAFTRKDPADREAFMAHWTRIRSDDTGRIQTVVFQGQVAGYVLSYQQDGETEVSYWLGRDTGGGGLRHARLPRFCVRYKSVRCTPAPPKITMLPCGCWKSADSRLSARIKAFPMRGAKRWKSFS